MIFRSRDDDATRRGDGNEATADQLEGLSIKELKALADKRKVDLTGCTEKGDLVNALVAARVARVDEDDPHILPDETRRIHDQEAFDYIQRIVELFGGYIGERSPLTLEELQNYEWPIKDIVMKFRTAGMRDGAIRTLEEAQKIYEEIPEDVRRTPEAISDYLWGSKRKDWSHIVAHSNRLFLVYIKKSRVSHSDSDFFHLNLSPNRQITRPKVEPVIPNLTLRPILTTRQRTKERAVAG